MSAIKTQIMSKLGEVMDPELFISIVDLGLVYKVEEKDGKVLVVMTLTTMGCPLFGTIEDEIKTKLKEIKGVAEVAVNLVFDPPWSMDRLTERARAQMGI
jgi:metal-sulfur cluster biosynthetic enzyme